VVFEGAQGVLLDEWHGFHPYTTWSTTTFANAETLLAEAGLAEAGLAEAGLAEAGLAEAGLAEAGLAEAGLAEAGLAEAGLAEAGLAEAGLAEAGLAEAGLAEAGRAGAGPGGAGGAVTRIGVIRCYQTRHGPGPFVTEDAGLELPEPHNARGAWQGEFRTGHLDAVALRYALEAAGGADVIALTHLDTAARHPELRICRSYDIDGEKVTRLPASPAGHLAAQEALTPRLLRARPVYDDADGDGDWTSTVEHALGVPVALASYGPRALDKRVPAAARPSSTRATGQARRSRIVALSIQPVGILTVRAHLAPDRAGADGA